MSAKEGTYALQHNHLLCDYYFVDSERLFGQDVRRIYISIIVLFALSTSISVRMCDSGSKVVRTCIGLIQGVQPEMNDVIINPSIRDNKSWSVELNCSDQDINIDTCTYIACGLV